MRFSWQIGLLLGVATQITLGAYGAVIEESYVEPLEVVIETPASGERTVVRDTYIEAYVPEPEYQQPSYDAVESSYSSEPVPVSDAPAPYSESEVASLRSLTQSEIKSLSLPTIGGREMQFPLALPAWISSSFGYRIHPISGESKFHQGTDIAAPEGTPVLAAWPGKVEIAGWMGGLGLAVVLSHDSGKRETRYGHLSQVLVEPGQVVQQGQAIGLVGSTGYSTGPHLHFELWEKQGEEWVVSNPTPALIVAMDRLEKYLARSAK